MSLRDQLLKAGLVSKKQAQKSESEKRKQDHDSKKNQQLAQQLQNQRKQELDEIEKQNQERHERDKELNKQRDALVLQRENYYRALQLINSNSLNTQTAQELYFFAENHYVRKIYVTSWQREMLARGKYAIARAYDDIDEFSILPLSTARLLKEIYPSKLIVLYTEIDDNAELDL